MNCFAKYPVAVPITRQVPRVQTAVVVGLVLPCRLLLVGGRTGVLAGLIFARPPPAEAVAVLGQNRVRVGKCYSVKDTPVTGLSIIAPAHTLA